MKWWQTNKRDADLDRELQSDLELEEEEQRENGLPPEEAYYAARRAFGNATLIREQTHEAWGWARFERLGQELRFALRRLRRSVGFSITAMLILGIGIGANTAIFSLVNTVLLRPMPFPEPDRLVEVLHVPPATSFPGVTRFAVSPANFLDWRALNKSFEGMSAFGSRQFALTGIDRPE